MENSGIDDRSAREMRLEIEAMQEEYEIYLARMGIEDQSEIEPPNYLDELAAAHWRVLVLKILLVGLSDSAFDFLAAYCTAWSRWQRAEEILKSEGDIIKAPSGYPIQHPALAISNRAQELLLKYGKMLNLPYFRDRFDDKEDYTR